MKKLTPSNNALKGLDSESLKESFINHLEFSLAKDQYSATQLDYLKSLSLTVRDRLIERWVETQQTYYSKPCKRVYYLSLEFLTGRMLGNAILNLDLEENVKPALMDLGHNLEAISDLEFDPGLGNGGLGRLAACFLDSMATLELPAYGYGIRYDFGIFNQKIENGYQVETPDSWLRYGNCWEIERPEFLYAVNFHGRVEHFSDEDGRFCARWVDTDQVMAMAYDTPVPGYRNSTVNTMRLWSAKSTRDFRLDYFNHGDYERAVSDKVHSETISKVLYPNDNVFEGRELRLKQQYFFVSASLNDILRRYRKCTHLASKKRNADNFDSFPDLVAIQLNDTHPSIGIAELMRLFLDEEGLDWESAWDIVTKTFAYTNHTVLPEALEKWSVGLMSAVLPRHMEIIYEINQRFMELVADRFPGDQNRLARTSIIEEGEEKRVRMAHLAIVGSHSVNGVSALHSEILVNQLFKDFYELWPEKFNNKTNGITQRRWLRLCNPEQSSLIAGRIGDGWVKDLSELKNLVPEAEDSGFLEEWRKVKRANKVRLAACIAAKNGTQVDADSLFDCQVKRFHEYKRQLLNCLRVIDHYCRIMDDPQGSYVPRTVIFAGKAAPGYYMAKLIIKLITSVAEVVNREAGDYLKVVFMANYGVSLAEMIIPAADLSEQISTAGTEASGTGNMKFTLNGALTIGTMDGANIEICREVGRENIFTFGLTADEVAAARSSGYVPWDIYNSNPELRRVIDTISSGVFAPGEPDLFKPIIDSLMGSDQYMLFADFDAYLRCQEHVDQLYAAPAEWCRKSVLNCAGAGWFSSDRTVGEYADEIWGAKPVPITLSNSENR